MRNAWQIKYTIFDIIIAISIGKKVGRTFILI